MAGRFYRFVVIDLPRFEKARPSNLRLRRLVRSTASELEIVIAEGI
jgi:hypothetical protein